MDARLNALRHSLESAVEGMSSEQLSWHLPGKWCAAEVLEHLYLTYTGTIKGFERSLEAGQPPARIPNWNDRFRSFVVLRVGYLPEGRTAPKNTTPRGFPPEQVLAEVSAKITAMDAVIAQAEEKYGKHTRLLDHPILGPLRGQEWRKFHWVHGQHHVKQMGNLRAMFSA